jgi:hypothetical protein
MHGCIYSYTLPLLLFFQASIAYASAENEQELVNHYLPQIEEYASQPAIIDALTVAAKEPFSLERTLEIDRNWLKDSNLRQQGAAHPLTAEFKKIVDNESQDISEILLIDIHGRLIASYPEASDYYQGDESKYIRPMADRKYFADAPDWDESSGRVTIQIAVPIFNNGQHIIGILVESVEVNLRILTRMNAK